MGGPPALWAKRLRLGKAMAGSVKAEPPTWVRSTFRSVHGTPALLAVVRAMRISTRWRWP